MKNIAIKIGANESNPIDLAIEPGTTQGDVLEHIKKNVAEIDLAGYALSKEDGKEQFTDNKNIYPLVNDGDKLFAYKVSKVSN